jgi:hypothetical protein
MHDTTCMLLNNGVCIVKCFKSRTSGIRKCVAALWAIACCTAHAWGADVVVVRPSGWSNALAPWKAYRQAQGHSIAEIDSAQSLESIRQSIRDVNAADPKSLKYILLASDVGPLAHKQIAVPTNYHRSKAMVKLGGDELIASDNAYADLDDDGIPDVAIGRIPADTPEQLASVLERTMAFEQLQDVDRWRRDVHVIAGVGGFGALADGVIEMTTRRFLSDRIPGWADLTMTQASPQSPYCPDPWRFSEVTIQRLNQGGMFWVYIGHGHVRNLDYLRCDNQWLPILSHENVPQINVQNHPPIAIFLACYTGAFDAVEDSLAEQLVMSPQGPVAALAASRVSGPYGLAMLANGMLSECFEQRTGTLGEVTLNAKRQMMLHETTPAPVATGEARGDIGAKSAPVDQTELLNALAGALSPEGHDLAIERQEHVWMMNLLGDPLLRLNHPSELELLELPQCKPGAPLRVTGNSKMAGELMIELAYRRDQTKPNLPQLNAFLPQLSNRAVTQEKYELANQRVICQTSLPIQAGQFTTELNIPPDLARGKYCIRAFLMGEGTWGTGYQVISVRP